VFSLVKGGVVATTEGVAGVVTTTEGMDMAVTVEEKTGIAGSM
jgi:hypothetical protein